MSRRPPPNSIDRSVLKNLNDRENFRKLIKSKEFNLERQKELRKIIEEQTQKLINQQKIKAKKLKANRGKNLRGELVANKNKQRRYERGERRYREEEEPRIVGDINVNIPNHIPQQFAGFNNQTPEDRQLMRDRLNLEYQDKYQARQLEYRDRDQARQLDFQQRLENARQERRRIDIDEQERRERVRLENRQLDLMERERVDKDARENRKLEIEEGRAEIELDELLNQREFRDEQLEQQGNIAQRLAELEELKIQNDRDIRADQNEIARLELQERRQGPDIEPIPEIPAGPRPFNIGDQQFFNNLLSGIAQDKQREREHTENIMRELLEHNERTNGAMNADILQRLYQQAQDTGLRPPGSVVESLGPNPGPPSVILAPPPQQPGASASEIASRVREALSEPPVGSQVSVGALTELERALEDQPEHPAVPAVANFLEGIEEAEDPPEQGSVSSISPSEYERRLTEAFARSPSEIARDEEVEAGIEALEQDFLRTPAGQAQQQALEDYEFVNPLDVENFTPSEVESFDRRAEETTERELEALREQGLTVKRLADIQEKERQEARLEAIRESQDIPAEPQAESGDEAGAGVGFLEGAGRAVGQGIVGVGQGALNLAGGVVQGAGEAIIEQLPTPGQVGQAVGRGLVAAGGAAAGALAGAVGGTLGRIEEVQEEEEGGAQEGLDIDDEALLEEVPISNRSPAQIADDNQDFDYGDFMVHHAEQSDKQRPPTLLERQRGPQYSISNTSDRDHKKLRPGERVDIVSYGKDKKGDSIGYYGASNPASNRREGLPTQLRTKALEKSIQKGYLKLHKNY